ncbi:MAG: MFS transporter [Paenibacillus sp.]|nr:MFS transporter [Paenibacillus sp.]
MGVIGILPSLAEHYNVSVSEAGLLVSSFALAVAISGPIMPLLFSGMNRKKVMLLVLGVFLLGNIVSILTTNLTLALIARIIPALFHPIYCSMAFSVAAASVSKEEAPKAISKVFIGVSAGMVIGVPIVSFIAATVSVEMAMGFFAFVNAVVFIATLIFVPSMPVTGKRLSYGSQVMVLKKSVTWLSIAAVILLNGSVFGVYSYFAEYLGKVTNMSANNIGLLLILFGAANMIGNVIAGRLLTENARKSITTFPFALGILYIVFFLFGQYIVPITIITMIWGVLAGIGGNFNQYLMMSAAPEAPDFTNGLFLTSANLGTTFGAAIGGVFISAWSTPYVIWVGILSLLLSVIVILLRNHRVAVNEQLSR